MIHSINVFLGFSLLFALVSCTPKPEPINFGKDNCVYCKMGIVDPKYGAELVSEKGKVYKFDAIECMLPFMHENTNESYTLFLAVSYDQPTQLFPVDSLYFVKSEKYKSPMGANIAAFVSKKNAVKEPLKIMNWEQLKDELNPQP
ncbi:MAG: nitrous oxide reductase accessory protein NosL [Chitinophagales bacterium]